MEIEFFENLRKEIDRFISLSNTKLSFGAKYRKETSIADLNMVQYTALVKLCKHGDYSITELSRDTCIDRANLTRALDILIEKGYIKKYRKENNRKSVYLTMTEFGRQTYDEYYRGFMDYFSKGLSTALNDDELEKFYESYRFIVAALERF